MIDLLTIPRFTDYDVSIPSQSQKGGGGMPIKIARVGAILKENFPRSKVVTQFEELSSDYIIIDAAYCQILTSANKERWGKFLEFLKNRPDAIKLLMCSELSLMRMLPDDVKELVQSVDHIAVNCHFLQKVLVYQDIYAARILCDPIPDEFFEPATAEREPAVVALGNISWYKNSMQVIDVFRELEGQGVKRIYLGSAAFWGDSRNLETAARLQQELYDVCDEVIEDAVQSEVVEVMKRCRAGLWVCIHDVFATSVHEMLASGLCVIGANHGLSDELPFPAYTESTDMATAIIEAIKSERWNIRSEKAREWAQDRVTTDVFLSQLRSMFT